MITEDPAHPLSDEWVRFVGYPDLTNVPRFKVGDVLSPVRKNVMARTKSGGFIHLLPGLRFDAHTIGPGYVLVWHPGMCELMCIMPIDLEVVL